MTLTSELSPFAALTIEELTRLSWLRGRLEAQAFSLCTTQDHTGWNCDWQTAGRLSCARWRVITGELHETQP